MSREVSIYPAYADAFRCIGSTCEDTCCQGWKVPFDQASWEKYQTLPGTALHDLIRESVEVRREECAAKPGFVGDSSAEFAFIRMNGENRCPLLNEERLCRIYGELGEDSLPNICAVYPRVAHLAGGIRETALALSCPEAARLVLLTPSLAEWEPSPESPSASGAGLPEGFWHIRTLVLRLVRNRAYLLWQRMFLIGLLCQRLAPMGRDEHERSAGEFLNDFEANVGTGSLRPMMEAMPVDHGAQLDVVLRLAGLMLHKSNVRPRFVECIEEFTRGIGNGPEVTFPMLAAAYARAYEQAFAAFFARHPHILENYLVTAMIRRQFPFGKEGMEPGARPNMARELSMLTAQFALMRGLLIGVAGGHGASFSADHVVHTVQVAAKHFEHHPKFLKRAHTVLVESGMDGARGWAILLRNAETDRAPADAPGAASRQAVAARLGGATTARRPASATVPGG